MRIESYATSSPFGLTDSKGLTLAVSCEAPMIDALILAFMSAKTIFHVPGSRSGCRSIDS